MRFDGSTSVLDCFHKKVESLLIVLDIGGETSLIADVDSILAVGVLDYLLQ